MIFRGTWTIDWPDKSAKAKSQKLSSKMWKRSQLGRLGQHSTLFSDSARSFSFYVPEGALTYHSPTCLPPASCVQHPLTTIRTPWCPMVWAKACITTWPVWFHQSQGWHSWKMCRFFFLPLFPRRVSPWASQLYLPHLSFPHETAFSKWFTLLIR